MSRQSTKPFRACQPTTGGGDPFPLAANAEGLGEKRKSALVVAMAIACGLAMSASAQIRDQACQWKYSPGGTGSFRNLAVGPALSGLRFGDFDGDGKTDVFVTVCP